MNNKTITLYPSNWIYNAGVVGFINSIENKYYNFHNGAVVCDKDCFPTLDLDGRYYGDKPTVAKITGNTKPYQNYIDVNGNQFPSFKKFIKSFNHLETQNKCNLCSSPYYLPDNILNTFNNDVKDFINKVTNFKIIHNYYLGPSEGEFPNSFWNLRQSVKLCHLCSFLIIHQHLAFNKLSDGSEIFVNTPSFKVMYELNKLVKEMYENKNIEESRSKREILATSIIEYSRKLASTLGQWTEMNIEIVIIKKIDKIRIDFFSLPYDIVKIISDRKIASLLSELGEYKILNKILDKNFSDLVNIGYLLIRESAKDFNQRNNDLIKSLLFRGHNQINLTQTANKILKLYSLIEEKLKRS